MIEDRTKMVTIQWLFWIYWILVIQRLSGIHGKANMLTVVNHSTSTFQEKQGINEDQPSQYVHGKRSQRTIRSLNSTNNPTAITATTRVNQNRSLISTRSIPTIRWLLLTLKIPTIVRTFYYLPPPPKVEPVTAIVPEVNCPGEPFSCANKCTNTTSFIRYSDFNFNQGIPCSCDPACNNMFMDCCSDFAEVCGNIDITEDNDDDISHKLIWRCENKINIIIQGCENAAGVWMIARCPSHWPNDNVKQKCHAATSKLEFESHDRFTPVVGFSDQLTYRNQYCAKCNDVSKFEFWNLIYGKKAVPPPFYTAEELAKFVSNNIRYFEGVVPSHGQRIRLCHYPNVISNCSIKSHNSRDACVNGTASLVEADGNVFKNKECALCNDVRATCGVGKHNTHHCSKDPNSISRVISLRDYSVTVETACPRNQVYDPYLKKCRQSYEWSNLNSGASDKYQVTLSVLKESTNEFYGTYEFKQEIALYFQTNKSQISIKYFIVKLDEYVITFTLCLTKSQSTIVATDPRFLGTSNETIGLRRLFKFEKAFALPISRRIVYQLLVRQLTCIRSRIYKFGEYAFLDDLRIRVNSTGSVYEQNEYFINTTKLNPNVSVCLKLSTLIACNGSFIKLNASEYQFTANLTLIYHSLSYNFGEYVYNNGTVFICAQFKRNYTTLGQLKDSLALVVITWFGFIVSIICLLALLVTYVIFHELRTLPGKNLINLSSSLCLAEILWLCGSSIEVNQVACTVIAIANHYLFLVFFTASSIVAFHSCSVFGKKINLRRSKPEENTMFLMYSLIAWGLPALFVLCFSLLDHQEIFHVDYGKTDICWLGTKQSKLFLFILPFGILIFFNLLLFVFVAVRLYKNQKSSAKIFEKIARKRQRQNVLVCIKLSTLMGFSWIFGLLQVAVETKTDAFAYLFVLFVSFQGLFISMAFLWKRTNYRLYSSLISKSGTTKSSNGRPSGHQNTKL